MDLRNDLKKDAIRALRTHEPSEVSVGATVGDAVACMRESKSGCVLVTEHRKPIGIFTERDVLTKVVGGHLALSTPLAEVMTHDPQAVAERNSVADVIRRMLTGGFRHMPVVDSSGNVTGVISVKRIVEYLVEHFPAAVFNLPPDPARPSTTREGA
jgi:CBS domain-containing protein